VARGKRGEPGRGRREERRVALDDRDALAAADPQGLRLLLLEGQTPPSSRYRRFLRPGEIWLMTVEPIAPPSVSNPTTTASSVVTGRARPSPPELWKAARAVDRTRSGRAVSMRAKTLTMR
jgi:hypothetical protein